MTTNKLKNKLQEIINQTENTIEKAVATEALEYENPEVFFSDLFRFGCVSGMIGSLVYTMDTQEFFDTHYDQIELLREEYEESTGTPMPNGFDLKNTYAWFGFEQTAYNMANELELEV